MGSRALACCQLGCHLPPGSYLQAGAVGIVSKVILHKEGSATSFSHGEETGSEKLRDQLRLHSLEGAAEPNVNPGLLPF